MGERPLGADLGSGPPPGRHDDVEVLRRLLDASPSVVFLLGPDGEIRWINRAVEHFAGYRPDEILGTNILDHVDPGWDPYAFDSIGAALGAEGLRLPMLFRVRRADGSMVVCEAVANAQLHDPVLGGLVVYLRRWDERMLLDQALETLAAGAPPESTFELLVSSLACETLEAEGSVVHADGDVEVRVVATPGLPSVLAGGHRDGPWRAALVSGERQEVSVAALPPDLAELAVARGYGTCWAWPIPDHETGTTRGCVVAWRRSDQVEADHARVLALDKVVRIAELALDLERSVSALHHAATHDPLTGLGNRAQLAAELDRAVGSVGLLSLDLDGFKPINDQLGHAAGDEVLVALAARLRAVARPDDLVARMGGDEFAVIRHSPADVAELDALAARLAAAVCEPIPVSAGGDLRVGVSIGGALGAPGCPPRDLLEAADAALYERKGAGKGGWRVVAIGEHASR